MSNQKVINMRADELFKVGLKDLKKRPELKNHARASIGAILQGNFGEHFDKTFFLVLYGYKKGSVVKDVGIDFYLASVPLEWDWFQSIIGSLKIYDKNLKTVHYSLTKFPIVQWEPENRIRINPKSYR